MRRWIVLVLLALAACSNTPANQTTIAVQPTEGSTATPVETTLPTVAPTTPPADQSTAIPAATAIPTEAPTLEPASTMPINPAAIAAGGVLIVPSSTDGSVWAIDPRTSEQVLLVDPTRSGQATRISISPDGKTIAALIIQGTLEQKIGDERTIPTSAELWIVNTDATNPRKLHSLIPAAGMQSIPSVDDYWTELHIFDNPIQWTATDELVVGSLQDGQPDLYAVSINDTNSRRLTNTPQIEYELKLDSTRRMLGYSAWNGFPRAVMGTRPTPEIWMQDLLGSPMLVIPEEIRLASDGLTLHGWVGDQLLVDGTTRKSDTEPLVPTLFSIRLNQALETVDLPEGGLWVSVQEDLALINIYGNDLVSSKVFVWDGSNAPQQIADESYPSYTLAPDHQALYGCNAFFSHPNYTDRDYQRRIIKLTGEIVTLQNGVCGNVHWSPDSQWVATGPMENPSEPDSYQHGYLTSITGQQIDLGADVIPAGWLDGDLLYFVPENSLWQLYRLTPGSSGLGQPIGKPLGVKPLNPSQIDA